jgi:hypothetical protein
LENLAEILPGILLEKDVHKPEDAAFGIADVKTPFQPEKISRKAVWEVLCDVPDSQYNRSDFTLRLKRKFLSIYANAAFGYYVLADGTTQVISISEGA